MNIKQRVAKALKVVLAELESPEAIQLAQWTLEDGQTIVEAESFEAGQNIFIVAEDGNIPLPPGEYKTSEQDGGVIIVVQEEGVIMEIKEGTAEEAPEQEEVEQEAAPAAQAKKVVESVSKETHFSKEDVEALNKEIEELKVSLSEAENKLKESEVNLSEAIATKEKVELELSETPAAKKIANAPKSSKKQINFNSQATTTRGRIIEGLNHLTK